MEVFIYSEGRKLIAKSGVGKAMSHQIKALDYAPVEVKTKGFIKNYDVIHINTIGPLSFLRAMMARAFDRAVIIHGHSTPEDFKNSFFFSNKMAKVFEKWLLYFYGRADLIITPTPYAKKLLETHGVKVPIEVLSNGVDVHHFVKNTEAARRFKETYRLSTDRSMILSVGLQIKRKGIHDFVALAKELPDYDFVWCGYTHPKLLSKEVNDIIQTAQSNVHFVGYINELIGAYSAADVFFMPTYEETEGIVVLEALSMACPVVVRDIPVYEGWLKDGYHCHKANDNIGFKEKIEAILQGRASKTCVNGRHLVESKSLEMIGSQLGSLYANLANHVTKQAI